MGDINNITEEANSSASIEEKQALLREQINAITPEFLEKKIDEVLSSPEFVQKMQERGLGADDLSNKKPEMVERLNQEMQDILKILPEMEETPEDLVGAKIDKAVQDFPQILDDALKTEIAKSIEAADERIKAKFDRAATRLEETGNYLENGELPADPDSEIRKEYDQGVISAADTILGMRALGPGAVDAMMKELPQDDFGNQVRELVNQRIAEEAAAAQQQQDVSAPSAIQP